jgi:hypothetical protein
MNGRVVPRGFLALFFLPVLLLLLAACVFEDDDVVDFDATAFAQQMGPTWTAQAATQASMAAATQTQVAQWTVEANATLTAAASKESLTETAVWLGETATTIAYMTEVWGTPTPSATATATPMATATPTASATPAGITQLLLEDPAGDAYNCAGGPGDVLALQPFLLDARQASISSDQQNVIARVSFDPAVGDLDQSVAQTGQFWNLTLAGYDPDDLLPPADPAVYAAALGNFGFAVLRQGNQIIGRGYDYDDGEWLAETLNEGVGFQFEGNSATLTVASTLMPDEGQFRLEVGYSQTQCDEVGSNGGPIIYFIKTSDPNYAFYFEQRETWTGEP